MKLASKVPMIGYMLGLVWVLSDCHLAKGADDPAVEKQYLEDLLVCVESAQTRVQADECRERVDSKYGVHRGR